MIIPINVSKSGPSLSNYTFPPQLAQFGSNEVVLIELQGSLEVDGDKEGQVVGKLRVDDVTVSMMSVRVVVSFAHALAAEKVDPSYRIPFARRQISESS